MKATYYNELKTLLQSISGLKYVGRWKNQIEQDKISGTPCVFIEITPITYNDNTAKRQDASNVAVILHLVMEKYTTEDTQDEEIYNLSQKIYNLLQNNGFSRQIESLDVTYDKLEDFQLTYLIGHIVDEDAMADYSEIDRPDPNYINQMNNPDGS
jgi:hypothetical protein